MDGWIFFIIFFSLAELRTTKTSEGSCWRKGVSNVHPRRASLWTCRIETYTFLINWPRLDFTSENCGCCACLIYVLVAQLGVAWHGWPGWVSGTHGRKTPLRATYRQLWVINTVKSSRQHCPPSSVSNSSSYSLLVLHTCVPLCLVCARLTCKRDRRGAG